MRDPEGGEKRIEITFTEAPLFEALGIVDDGGTELP